MTTLFLICALVGVIWLILENGAKYSSPAPSMYRTSGNGWVLVLIGAIGWICVRFMP